MFYVGAIMTDNAPLPLSVSYAESSPQGAEQGLTRGNRALFAICACKYLQDVVKYFKYLFKRGNEF
jgi:hypothetical protein